MDGHDAAVDEMVSAPLPRVGVKEAGIEAVTLSLSLGLREACIALEYHTWSRRPWCWMGRGMTKTFQVRR
jgi:hypothetical protein